VRSPVIALSPSSSNSLFFIIHDLEGEWALRRFVTNCIQFHRFCETVFVGIRSGKGNFPEYGIRNKECSGLNAEIMCATLYFGKLKKLRHKQGLE